MRASSSASSSRPLTIASDRRMSEPTEKPLRYQATCLRKSVQPCSSPWSALSSSACRCMIAATSRIVGSARRRSEEHTSELQSRQYLVCRLLLEKKKNTLTNLHLIQLSIHVQ